MSAATPIRPLSPHEAQRWTRVGLLAALAMLLGYAETFVVIPIPGVKLGIANAAVLATLATGDVPGAFCVALIKALATGMLFGSPLTLAYSLAGTLLAFVGMAPLSRLRTMRLFMVSVVGSVLHQTGQLVVASVLLGTNAVWVAAPVLLVAGCITGVLTGLLAQRLSEALPPLDATSPTAPHTPEAPQAPSMRTALASAAFVVLALVTLHARTDALLVTCVALGFVGCLLARVRANRLARCLRLIVVVGALTFALQYLVRPTTACEETRVATLRLAALVLAGVALMHVVGTNHLVGTVSWLVSPLERVGVRTSGFVLAFDVALHLLPSMAGIMRERFANGIPLRWDALNSLLPDLVQEVYRRAS